MEKKPLKTKAVIIGMSVIAKEVNRAAYSESVSF